MTKAKKMTKEEYFNLDEEEKWQMGWKDILKIFGWNGFNFADEEMQKEFEMAQREIDEERWEGASDEEFFVCMDRDGNFFSAGDPYNSFASKDYVLGYSDEWGKKWDDDDDARYVVLQYIGTGWGDIDCFDLDGFEFDYPDFLEQMIELIGGELVFAKKWREYLEEKNYFSNLREAGEEALDNMEFYIDNEEEVEKAKKEIREMVKKGDENKFLVWVARKIMEKYNYNISILNCFSESIVTFFQTKFPKEYKKWNHECLSDSFGTDEYNPCPY